ncbi:Coenzyme F420 hydrogenase/dehydrogenase, beta subunit N-term [Lacrimispora sphenoides]|jgi:coenzyme F420-reducing hydrogenase beta subunit|uniref:Coenzyme F420 hydrogenase/dehydrogenase, beta subunit C-terminal domain n=1 Tax=Lacrimispora sphenoides TaxID=29370 RepID=UPI0008D16A66|nr:Coenzyme F420 hydrogenase/dehydrogenase, beta subunit C-terminal domain [Lacrimispora sphenoides]SET90722.1 Coenzyme F420 hydrogenase/dehydrogenase, beta subunit N-term [Lacrimispora sphenoides]
MILACYNKKESIRMQSSSGGIYYTIAKNVLDNSGIVYAVLYDNLSVVHTRIDSVHLLEKSCGSKYAQSNMKDCFSLVKEDLQNGRKVLFVGTPCQCAGLKAYLSKDYINLLAIDFICHGVPSKKVLNRYLNEQQYLQPIDTINMRDKTSGWTNYQYSWKFSNANETKVLSQSNIAFMKGFTGDLFLRPSCYECCFKGLERKTDITLGDYWGVWNIQPGMDDNKGTSLAIIHSENGKKAFEIVANEFVYEEITDYNKVINYNPSICKRAEKTVKREKFFERFNSGDTVEGIVNDLLRSNEQFGMKSRLIRKIKGFLSN